MVSIAHRPNDKLCHGTSKLFIGVSTAYLFCQLQHTQEFTVEIFLWCQCVQTLLCWAFQVHRNTICQLHQPIELVIFYSRHDFEMQIALVVVAVTHNFSSINNLVLGGHASLDDPR